LSRTGLLMLVSFTLSLALLSRVPLKKRFYYLVVSIVLILFILFIASETDILELYKHRLTSEADLQSGLSRLYETYAGLYYLITEFPISLIGMGFGVSGIWEFFHNYYPITQGFEPRIHNTYISLLVENGLLGFLIFIYIIYRNLKWLLYSQDDRRVLYISLYTSVLVGSNFCWTPYFLPFYITVFYLPYMLKYRVK